MKKLADLSIDERTKLALLYPKPGSESELDELEWEYAQNSNQQTNDDLRLREQPSDVFNGIPFSEAYVYNRRKAINYSPPRNPGDDRQVSLGIVHEKIVALCAIFLKYVWKRRVKYYDEYGRLIDDLGEVLDLAVEHSYRLEKFQRLILLILWEVFVQGDAWVMEDWQVRLVPRRKAFMRDPESGERVEVTPDNMDYTLEFMEGLTWEEAEPHQERMARSVLLDGRQVILGNPEIEEVQEQPRLTIEMEFPRTLAAQLFGSLKRWNSVPRSYEDINLLCGDATTLFDAKRLKKPDETVIAHFKFDRFKNTYNLHLNGAMMLPRQTSMELFYPRMNYPLTGVHGERLKGSAYSRSVPAKTKFNADFADWATKMLAEKFEQGISPAILSNGKYTLTRDMFRASQVTHGVKKDDYEKADPDNKGVTQADMAVVEFIKQILETQTANASSSGELSKDATATEISVTDANQVTKLGFLLDGLVLGMMDMASRRIETIESKYTLKKRKTVIDGKDVAVYQNFTVQAYGSQHHVIMDASVGSEGYDKQGNEDTLHDMALHDRKKRGVSSKYYLVNPEYIRERRGSCDVEMMPERRKDTQLQMISFFEELKNVKESFPGQTNDDKWKEEYLEISGRPEDVFNSKDMEQLAKEAAAAQATGEQPAGGAPAPGQPQAPKPYSRPRPTPQMLNQQR